MKVDPSAIDSPLALIALFVAIIELFLIFPIAKLDGRDRSLLVAFVIGYPVFIAGAFFVFLWNKPVNLYKPQTLSEHLQEALLPERLNGQLAPDRAAVAVIELKVTTLETQLREVSQRMQASAGGGNAPSDVAKLSDLEKLKADLLARAEASGDVSRGGLASAAREIQTQEIKSQSARVSSATAQIERFKLWAQSNGLKVLPPLPTIAANSNPSSGPFVGPTSITMGTPETDYLIPGMYVHRVAASQGFKDNFENLTSQLMWTTADYMACRFGKTVFPGPTGPISSTNYRATYSEMYSLFGQLVNSNGNSSVQAGVINMMNEWNPKSDLQSSLASFANGMLAAGADSKSVDAVFAKFRAQVAELVSAAK